MASHEDEHVPGEEEGETFLDPSETAEEFAHDPHADHPMSDDDDDDMPDEDDELIVDDSIQGFFLHTAPIYAVALHGNWAVTGAGDDLGYVWDVTNGEMIMKLDGHTDSVTNVQFSGDGKFLATGGMDGQVRIWSVEEKKLEVAVEGGREVLWLNWHPSGPVLLAGMDDGTVWMWKIPSGTVMQVFSGHSGPCAAGSFSPNGKNIVTCSDDGSLISWVPQSGAVAWKITGDDTRFEAGPLTSLAINPANSVVAVGSQEGLIHLISLSNGTIHATLGAKTGDSIESLAFATTLPLLAAASVDGRIYLYDTQTFRLRNSLSHDDAVTAMVLRGWELTSTSIDRTVRRWDIRTGTELGKRTGHQDAIVGGLALNEDGRKVVTGGDDSVALVWGF